MDFASLNLNLASDKEKAVETTGTLAESKASQLFVPASSTETTGTLASGSSSSSSGSGVSYNA